MQTIRVELEERSYTVTVAAGILGTVNDAIKVPAGSAALIISNETVAPIYLQLLKDSLAGTETHTLILPDGEQFKTLQYWSKIIDELVKIRASRDVTLLTLGGGVIGDMGGFAAACYMRGVRFIQIPTSLLAQVDASVGGKTGFNHTRGKNLVGSFHQPASVLVDIDTLKTLPDREFSAGMAEVVKIAAIRDASFLGWLEDHCEKINARDSDVLISMITRSIMNKAEVVAEDEREAGVRALLNFGHSFAHALETLTNYDKYLHGEAVSIGMMVATRLSELRGLCSAGISDRLGQLLHSFGLPLEMPHNAHPDKILKLMKLDKKVIAGAYRLILLSTAGRGLIDSDSSNEQITAAIVASQSA